MLRTVWGTRGCMGCSWIQWVFLTTMGAHGHDVFSWPLWVLMAMMGAPHPGSTLRGAAGQAQGAVDGRQLLPQALHLPLRRLRTLQESRKHVRGGAPRLIPPLGQNGVPAPTSTHPIPWLGAQPQLNPPQNGAEGPARFGGAAVQREAEPLFAGTPQFWGAQLEPGHRCAIFWHQHKGHWDFWGASVG